MKWGIQNCNKDSTFNILLRSETKQGQSLGSEEQSKTHQGTTYVEIMIKHERERERWTCSCCGAFIAKASKAGEREGH